MHSRTPAIGGAILVSALVAVVPHATATCAPLASVPLFLPASPAHHDAEHCGVLEPPEWAAPSRAPVKGGGFWHEVLRV